MAEHIYQEDDVLSIFLIYVSCVFSVSLDSICAKHFYFFKDDEQEDGESDDDEVFFFVFFIFSPTFINFENFVERGATRRTMTRLLLPTRNLLNRESEKVCVECFRKCWPYLVFSFSLF